MRRPFIAGNWKMNGTKAMVAQLLSFLRHETQLFIEVDWVVFPPFIYIPQVENTLLNSKISWGAQDVSSFKDGAYTGEISTSMLKDFNCQYVLIGHSERRHIFKEDQLTVAAKFKAALAAGLKPLLCVGETEDQRQKGLTFEVIQEQLEILFELKDNFSFGELVIAYEPVWAIGTGKTALPDQAQEVHLAIRNRIGEYDLEFASKVRIIYGGSVTPQNIASLISMPDIDGALVGGASLEGNKFTEIGKICNRSF